MKLAGEYSLPVEQARTFDMLHDPVVLAKCMPGCESLDRTAENEYTMRMKMILASMSGLFQGTVKVADSHPHDSFRLIVEGTGKIGFMHGEGVLTLTPNAEGTDVKYEGEVQIGGTIAAVGQRLLDTTSKMLIKRFFGKLASEAALASHA